MRLETLGWSLVAASTYAVLTLIRLLRTGRIEYSPSDFDLGIVLGFARLVLTLVSVVGAGMVLHDAARRPHQAWL